MSPSAERTLPHSVPGPNTRSHKEDATLRRLTGFVAWTSLLAAVLWWVNLGETAETSPRAKVRAAGSDAPQTALDWVAKGKEHYLQRRFAEAVEAFEAAKAWSIDLSEADRSNLEKWLTHARTKRDGRSGAGEVGARGQSVETRSPSAGRRAALEPPSASANPAKGAEAAKRLIAEARAKFNAGKITEAEQLAKSCESLGVPTRMFRDSPQKILEDIKKYREQEASWKKDSSSTQAKRGRSNYLLERARQLIDEHDLANAERFVR